MIFPQKKYSLAHSTTQFSLHLMNFNFIIMYRVFFFFAIMSFSCVFSGKNVFRLYIYFFHHHIIGTLSVTQSPILLFDIFTTFHFITHWIFKLKIYWLAFTGKKYGTKIRRDYIYMKKYMLAFICLTLKLRNKKLQANPLNGLYAFRLCIKRFFLAINR